MVNKTLITLATLVFLCASHALAGDKAEGPSILAARVFVADSLIMSDLTSRGLFPDRIVRTVESGLPAVVELLYALVTRDDKTVSRGLHSYELRYDVWEDVYSVTGTDSLPRYASFREMAGIIEHLRRIPIVPLESIDTTGEYAIRFCIAVHPLQGREKQRITGWVGENVSGGTEEGWREQVLNLNDLIQHFFAREKVSASRSEWYATEPFRPRLLPADDERRKEE